MVQDISMQKIKVSKSAKLFTNICRTTDKVWKLLDNRIKRNTRNVRKTRTNIMLRVFSRSRVYVKNEGKIAKKSTMFKAALQNFRLLGQAEKRTINSTAKNVFKDSLVISQLSFMML